MSINAKEHDYSSAWLHPVIPASREVAIPPITLIRANQINLADTFAFTGPTSFANVTSLNVSGAGTFTGLFTCKNLFNIRCVASANPQGWSGANEGAWFNSAALDLQNNTSFKPGMIDARGLGTTGTVSADLFNTVTIPVQAQFGSTNFTVSATINPTAGSSFIGNAPFQGEGFINTGQHTVWTNTSSSVNTFTLNTSSLTNVSLCGMNYEGSGTNAHIFLENGATTRICDSTFQGKSNGINFNATLGSVYDEAVIGNLFKTASDSVLFSGGSFQNPNHRYRDNWFRKDDACCHAGKGINIPTGIGISGDVWNNACSGMTDAAHGTCFELGSSRGFVIGANDIENLTAGGGNFFPIDVSNSNGYSILANNWSSVPGGIFAAGNYAFIAPQYFTSLTAGATNFLQFFQGGVGNVILGAPAGAGPSAGKTNLTGSGGNVFITYDDGSFEQTEGTAPTAFNTGHDRMWPDSTAHRWKMNNNNAATDVLVGAATTDTLTNKTLSTPLNGLTCAGQCAPVIVGVTSQKSESAADTALLTVTPAAVAGTYRLRFVMSISAANAATLGWTATYTDSNGNAQAPTNLSFYQTGVAAPALTVTTSTTGNFYGQADIDVNNAGTNIVIKLTFSGTSFTAKVSATVERII